MHRIAALTLVVGLASIASPLVIGQAPPATDPWTPVSDWAPVVPDEMDQAITKLVRARVDAMIEVGDPPKFKHEYGGHELEFGALRSLALMAALPRLAQQDPADNQPEAKKRFEAARKIAIAGIQPVLEVALPEYWEEIHGRTVAKPFSLREMVGREHNRGDKKLTFNLTRRAYGISVTLMALEFYFSGGTNLSFETGRQAGDRGARVAASLTPSAQLGIARLTTLLLLGQANAVPNYDDQFKSTLNDGALFSYDQLGHSPQASCMSKTSTALMGLRAAVALGVHHFPEEAFKFSLEKGGPEMTKARFLQRLSDVFVHCVVGITEIKAETATTAVGILDRNNFAAVSPARSSAAPPSAEVNVLEYRARYARDAKGRPIVRLYHSDVSMTNPDAGLLDTKPKESAYRYLHGADSSWHYGAYHTAGAGYTLATSLTALPLVWQAAPRPADVTATPLIDGAYKVWAKPSVPGELPSWKVEIKGVVHEVTLHPEQSLTPVKFGTLEVRERLAQTLNFICRQLTKDSGPTKLRELNDTIRPVAGGAPHMDAVLSLSVDHQPLFRGIAIYGVFKFMLSVGTPDALGNWRPYPDLVKWLSDSNYSGLKGNDQWAHNEFLILTVTRSYRPLYGRDSPQLTGP